MIEELIIPEKLVGTELLCYLYPKKFDDQKINLQWICYIKYVLQI